MTVQELLDKLNKIEDKNVEVYAKEMWSGNYWDINDVNTDKDGNVILLEY